MGNTMKKKSILLVFAVFIGISLTVLVGFARQAQAVMSNMELTGTVEQKKRSAEPSPARYVEPGNPVSRADRATAIMVDGRWMFILPETIVKKPETVVKKNDGAIIDFDELAVPCQAKIVYQQLPNGGRNVLEIHILSESAGASKKWAAPLPQ